VRGNPFLQFVVQPVTPEDDQLRKENKPQLMRRTTLQSKNLIEIRALLVSSGRNPKQKHTEIAHNLSWQLRETVASKYRLPCLNVKLGQQGKITNIHIQKSISCSRRLLKSKFYRSKFVGKDTVFRFIIEYSSLMDFGP
jgi:hypothetical protein